MKTKLKETKSAKPVKAAPTPVEIEKQGSKTQQVVAMLSKADGTSIADIQKATGWQRHSVHGFISGTLKKKMGLNIESSKDDAAARRYKIVCNNEL